MQTYATTGRGLQGLPQRGKPVQAARMGSLNAQAQNNLRLRTNPASLMQPKRKVLTKKIFVLYYLRKKEERNEKSN